MLSETNLRSANFRLLLTITMIFMTACSGTEEAGGDSNPADPGSTGDATDTNEQTPGSDDETPNGENTGGENTDDETEEPAAPIGNPIGDSIQIDHAKVKLAVELNLAAHIDGLQAALIFVETSNTLKNLVEVFLDDEDDEGSDDEPQDDEPQDDEPQDDEPAIEVDFSEFRDELLETVSDRILVESTAVLSDDGTQLIYTFTPEYFCVSEETDEVLSEEELAERAEDEADCANRITTTPLRLVATSDADNDVNLVFMVGSDELEAFRFQVHDDMLSAVANLPGVKAFLEVFIDAEDFEFPDTMDGSAGGEIRNTGTLQYDLRFAINEAIELAAGPGQETIVVDFDQNLEPGSLSLNGVAGTISGGAELTNVLIGLPWQMVVDSFWDDEGTIETQCETDEETNEMNCTDVYVEAPEAPDVSGMVHAQISGISGSVDVSSLEDVFNFTNLSLGNAPIVIDVSGEPILTFNLNPSHDGLLHIKMVGDTPLSTRWEMSPSLDATVVFSMEDVQDGFQDLPEFMLNETLGVRMEAEEELIPSMSLMRDAEDSIDLQVVSGELTLWSDAMESDVVVTAGQCIDSIDEETLTDEEQDAQHDLFGGLYGANCSE